MRVAVLTRPGVRGLAVLAGAAILVSVLPAAGCGRGPVARAAPVPAPAIPRLTRIARRAAARNSDPHPVWITAVLTTCAKAGARAPVGRYVSLVIDAATFRGLDFGISPRLAVPPASLGPVTCLIRGGGAAQVSC